MRSGTELSRLVGVMCCWSSDCSTTRIGRGRLQAIRLAKFVDEARSLVSERYYEGPAPASRATASGDTHPGRDAPLLIELNGGCAPDGDRRARADQYRRQRPAKILHEVRRGCRLGGRHRRRARADWRPTASRRVLTKMMSASGTECATGRSSRDHVLVDPQ
jgi:hypothetical protein